MTSTVRTETPDDRTVVVSVTVSAGRERVFRAFTDPVEFAAWWWPERLATKYDLDVRENGDFHFRTTAMPEGDNFGVHGQYLRLSPPERLVMSWIWDGEDDATRVEVELRAAGDTATEVVVTHSAHGSTDARDQHAEGWLACLGRLVERLG